MGGGSKTTTTQTVTRTPEEIAYTKQQIELAQKQMDLVEQQQGIQSEIYTLTKPLLEKYISLMDQDIAAQNDPVALAQKAKQNQLTDLQLDSAIKNQPLQDQILQMQLDQLKNGGKATDEQKALIADIANRSLEAGQTDINRFMDKGLDQIRTQMAPARGMRPDDAPMIDAAQRVLEEATRQQGQLTQQVRGAQANAELNFPLNASQITGQQAQWQQQFGAGMGEFLANLGAKAQANRTNLMQQLFSGAGYGTESGLNLINAARPNPVNFTQNTTTTQKQSGGSILGGIGGLLSGVGSIASSGIFSSRRFKTDIKPLEAPPGHMLSPGALKTGFKTVSEAEPAVGGPQRTLGLNFQPALTGGPSVSSAPKPDLAGTVTKDPPWMGGGKPDLSGTPIWDPPAPQPPQTDEDVLARIGSIPVSSWQYKPGTGLEGPTHVGPMAEDFNTKVMGKGPEPFINTVDAFGTLMAGIKALDKRTKGLGMTKKKRPAYAGGR